ncbi:hypothetical protein B0T18DRAFT_255143 [Schizothecium vesticola]|uniref:Uncharacterized protein n=1 Tax=Schizothecium vesticola TaxID=314040 RepID=A0AA40EHG8_9PEZI|nr:hypothetical protein B0T18DRAFT_255143 [Schizothecium vesticola]
MDAHRSVAEPPSVTWTLAEIDRDKNGHFRTRSTWFAPNASEAGPRCIPSRAVSTLDGGLASRGSRSVARYPNTGISSMSSGRPPSQCWIRPHLFQHSRHPYIRGAETSKWQDTLCGLTANRMTMPLCATHPIRVLPSLTIVRLQNRWANTPSARAIRFGIPGVVPASSPVEPANPIATSPHRESLALSASSARSLASRVPVPDPRGRRQPIQPPVPPPSFRRVARSQSRHHTRHVKAMSNMVYGAQFLCRTVVCTPPSCNPPHPTEAFGASPRGPAPICGIGNRAGRYPTERGRPLPAPATTNLLLFPGSTAHPSSRLVFLSRIG